MGKKSSDCFVLCLGGYAEGQCAVSYVISSSFLSNYPKALFRSCSGELHVEMHKTSTFVSLSLKIDCEVGLFCDRTLRPFREKLCIEKKLWIKWAEKVDTEGEEFILLSQGVETLSLDQHVYDFISLAIPMKQLHPDCRVESQEDILLYSTYRSTSEQVDTRWEVLQQLLPEFQTSMYHGASKTKNLSYKKK